MNEQQLIIGIAISTVFIVAMIVTFLIILIRLHRRAERAEEFLSHSDVVQKRQNEELNKLMKLLREQIPHQPELKYIKYYSEHKPVEVHMIHKELGIAVISDIGQLNYKIRTVDELSDASG